VTVGENVKSIGGSAFAWCSSLQGVYISNLAKWCDIYFEIRVEYHGDPWGYSEYYCYYESNPLYDAKKLYLNGELVTDLNIPDGVKKIGQLAFYNCSSLKSIAIPNSVSDIGERAFYGCQPSKVTVPGWKCGIDFSNVTNLAIAEGVADIGSSAFADCPLLEDVVIPDSVKRIQNTAFDNTPFGGKIYTETVKLVAEKLSGDSGSSSSGGNTSVQYEESRYLLSNEVADRSIANVKVSEDTAIDEFVLKDGKVFDAVLRVVNESDNDVYLTLPAGYEYETMKGAKPLSIPAKSRNILTITRVTDGVFLVARQELESVQ
jgi:hypothetical protein